MEATATEQPLTLEQENSLLREKLHEAMVALEKMRVSQQLLQDKIHALLSSRFARSSEQLNPGQLRLFEVGAPLAPVPAKTETVTYTRKKPQPPGHGRGTFPAHLPRNEIKVDPPEHERLCTCCGRALVCLRRDIVERGDVIPAKILVNQYDIGVWACSTGCVAPKSESLPPTVVPKSKWEPSAYAYVAVAKFGDHTPLHRQMTIFQRHGVHFPKSTLCDMALAVSTAVASVVNHAQTELLESDVLLADETPIPVMVPGDEGSAKKRKVKTGYLWVYRTPDGKRVSFEFTPNRSRNGPSEFLKDWHGTLLTDEYSGYDEVCRTNGLVRAHCWAHARRRFKDACAPRPKEAAEAIHRIDQLFLVERAIERFIDRRQSEALADGEAPLDDAAKAKIRLSFRQRWSAPLVKTLHARLLEWRSDPSVVPKGLFGVAVRYLIPDQPRQHIWERFTVFLDDGRVPIHNNGSENSIRPAVLGRKNWLFAGSVRGGDAAARIYSLILTCKALEVNPEEYLADILARLDSASPAQLTPWAWKQERDTRLHAEAQARAHQAQVDAAAAPSA